jgi:hypothetical protein
MTEHDRDVFYKTWSGCYDVLGMAQKKPSEYGMSICFESLKKYPLLDIQRALGAHLRESQFPPKPADIISRLEGSVEEQATLAWQFVLRCAAKYGYTTSLRFPDPAIVYAIERMGGWQEVCSITTDVLPFREQDFARHFAVAKRNDVGWDVVPPYCIGWGERTRRRDGYELQPGTIVDAKTGEFLEDYEALGSGTAEEKELSALTSGIVKRVG